jgi:hypothetical protein
MKHETSRMKCHICYVESTFAEMTRIVHVKCTKLCPFNMLMKCPFDIEWTYVISPFDIHVDVNHVMPI